jgi:Mrp family chromosome partitioning ATPase
MSPLGEAFRKAMERQGPARPPPERPRPPMPQFDLAALPGSPPPAEPTVQPVLPPPPFAGPNDARAPHQGFDGPPGLNPGASEMLTRASRVATFAEGPLAPGCDELAGLRAALMAAGLEGMSATLMIAGTAPPFVVTAVAVGLAGELARDLVHNVLLLDADVHAPSVAAMLQVDPEFDFADVLDGRAEAAEAILHSEADNLSAMVLRADPFVGASRANAETLAGPVARDTLLSLHEAFDYIVIDAGSFEGSAVPRVLAARSTGVVMVIESGTSRDTARACRAMIESAGGKILGTVLTGVRSRRKAAKG